MFADSACNTLFYVFTLRLSGSFSAAAVSAEILVSFGVSIVAMDGSIMMDGLMI